MSLNRQDQFSPIYHIWATCGKTHVNIHIRCVNNNISKFTHLLTHFLMCMKYNDTVLGYHQSIPKIVCKTLHGTTSTKLQAYTKIKHHRRSFLCSHGQKHVHIRHIHSFDFKAFFASMSFYLQWLDDIFVVTKQKILKEWFPEH